MAAGKLRVIVIDDNEDVRAVMRMAFELDGRFDLVAVGENAQRAIWLASLHQPDAMLLDLRMPEMDGLAALPGIRREAAGTKVVLFSVLDDEVMLPRVEAAGAHGYVSKSTSPIEIVQRVADLCTATDDETSSDRTGDVP